MPGNRSGMRRVGHEPIEIRISTVACIASVRVRSFAGRFAGLRIGFAEREGPGHGFAERDAEFSIWSLLLPPE